MGQSGCAWLKVGKRFSYCTYFCMKKSEKGVCVCVRVQKVLKEELSIIWHHDRWGRDSVIMAHSCAVAAS